MDRSGPDAPQATACDPNTTQCSQFFNNRAISSTISNGNGGAIYNNGSLLQVNNTYLHRNEAVRGGAIYQENAAARGWLSNTLVYSNTSLLSFGAGIRNAGGAMTLTHVTAANNIGGAGFSPGSAQSYVYNTIIWGNSVAAFGALTATSCNIDQGGTAGPANESAVHGRRVQARIITWAMARRRLTLARPACRAIWKTRRGLTARSSTWACTKAICTLCICR